MRTAFADWMTAAASRLPAPPDTNERYRIEGESGGERRNAGSQSHEHELLGPAPRHLVRRRHGRRITAIRERAADGSTTYAVCARPNSRGSNATFTATSRSKATCCSRAPCGSRRHQACESSGIAVTSDGNPSTGCWEEGPMTRDVLVAPEEVMLQAVRGSLTKHALATLLTPRA